MMKVNSKFMVTTVLPSQLLAYRRRPILVFVSVHSFSGGVFKFNASYRINVNILLGENDKLTKLTVF
jgi:hypothetical protein